MRLVDLPLLSPDCYLPVTNNEISAISQEFPGVRAGVLADFGSPEVIQVSQTPQRSSYSAPPRPVPRSAARVSIEEPAVRVRRFVIGRDERKGRSAFELLRCVSLLLADFVAKDG
jgi:hypothetical protein